MTDVLRVYKNTLALLTEGSFPGKFAHLVHEAIGLCEGLVAKMEKDLEQAGQEPGPSVGDAPDASGLAGDPVPNP